MRLLGFLHVGKRCNQLLTCFRWWNAIWYFDNSYHAHIWRYTGPLCWSMLQGTWATGVGNGDSSLSESTQPEATRSQAVEMFGLNRYQYPLGMTNSFLLKMAIEIPSAPINSMLNFQFASSVNVYQRVYPSIYRNSPAIIPPKKTSNHSKPY